MESGRKADRTGRAAALALCRARRATLLVAKPNRLARSVAFISNLMEGGVGFAAADRPGVNRLTAHVLAAAPQPSTPGGKARTVAAQARAVAAYGTVIQAARAAGALSLGDCAQALRAARLPAPRGDRWSRPCVARVLRRCTSVEGGLRSGPNAVARRGAATGHPPEAP